MDVSQTPGPDILHSPVRFLAFGFGSGLVPRAPGTAGTLAAVPLYYLAADWNLTVYSLVVLLAGAAGVWICDTTSRHMQVHDHPGIVWDEFVGYWITMWAVPPDWLWMVIGFSVFRVFDIVKPWPVSVVDRRVEGGLGIMADDVLAGVMACATLHIAIWVLAL